jgi:hypothetical protein
MFKTTWQHAYKIFETLTILNVQLIEVIGRHRQRPVSIVMFVLISSLSFFPFRVRKFTARAAERRSSDAVSSSLHGLGESPVPAYSIVVSLSIVFLVCLCLPMLYHHHFMD